MASALASYLVGGVCTLGYFGDPFDPITHYGTGKTGNTSLLQFQSCSLPIGTRVHLSIIDVHGRRVAVFAEGLRTLGSHEIGWDRRDSFGADCSNRIYFVRPAVRGSVAVGRVLEIR